MTTQARYNKETMRMEMVSVEGNGDNGNDTDAQKWWAVPADVVATLLRYAQEDKLDLGDSNDTVRARAAAQGRARNLFLEVAARGFISQRDVKAKAEAEAKAKAKIEAEAKAKAEPAKPTAQIPPIAKPEGNSKAPVQSVQKQPQLVK